MQDNKTETNMNLPNFIATGKIPGIEIGMSPKTLLSILGETDMYAPISRKNSRIEILKYGDIEFFFDGDNRLYMIFFDYFDIPKGEYGLSVEPEWVNSSLTTESAKKMLSEVGIKWEEKKNSLDDDGVGLCLESGVELSFEHSSDKSSDSLVAVTYKKNLSPLDPKKQIGISVPEPVYDQIKKYAALKGIPIAKVCNNWICEKVELLTERDSEQKNKLDL